jgi:hypothetical protein
MKDGLAGGGAAVDTDVVAVGAVFGFDDRLGGVDSRGEGVALPCSGVEPGGYVSVGDQERVAGRCGEGVP